MTAIPELVSETPTADTSTPLAANASNSWGPKASFPTRPTIITRPPIRAAATAWLAPFPPG